MKKMTVAILALIISFSALGKDQGTKYTTEEIRKHSSDYFFKRLGKSQEELKKDGGYHYYAAMWALAKKCEISPESRESILKKAISVFNGKNDTMTKIQCQGVMAEAENVKHSPETYKLMLNALHKNENKQIRSFSAYSLLWYKDQSDVIAQLEQALDSEQAKSVKDSIKATIGRIKKKND